MNRSMRTWLREPLKLPTLCAITLLIGGGVLVAGLWPFRFRPGNDVAWLSEETGLHLRGPASNPPGAGGAALSDGALVARGAQPRHAGALSLELSLLADSVEPGVSGRIVAFLDEHGADILAVDQWSQALVVRTWGGASVTRRRARKDMSLGEPMCVGARQHVVITTDRTGTRLFLDGREAHRFPGEPLLNEDQAPGNLSLVVGNAADGHAPWSGTVFRLALYAGAMEPEDVRRLARESSGHKPARVVSGASDALGIYAFTAGHGRKISCAEGPARDLRIPERMPPLALPLRLTVPSRAAMHSFLRDALLNTGGFVPVGVVFAAWLRRLGMRTHLAIALVATGGACALSSVIETAQAFLPTRDSSIIDLGINTMGALLGTCVVRWCGVNDASAKRPGDTP